jgi:lipopolysaccharide heptosyltransferase I
LQTQTKFRLLVVRLGAMGDILHALPAVTALRAAHPEWEIGWVVDPRWRALLKAENRDQGSGIRDQGSGVSPAQPLPVQPLPAQPLVDRLHFAPAKEWKRRPLSPETSKEIRALRRELRGCGYDAVLDLQGAVRSAVIARMAGCGRVIGESHPREQAARWLFSERVATTGAHVAEQDVELASAVAGDALTPATPLLPVEPAAEAWCDELVARGGGGPVALLAPGAGWGAKRWPPARYAAVARGLAVRGFRVLVNTGPGEEALAGEIAEGSGGAAEALSATLAQLIALTRRVALCVGGDTGPLHLACALGRRVVGIYGPTDPSRNGPFGTRAKVLRNPASRRDHTRRDAPEAGLLTIAPEDVLRAAGELLAEEDGE